MLVIGLLILVFLFFCVMIIVYVAAIATSRARFARDPEKAKAEVKLFTVCWEKVEEDLQSKGVYKLSRKRKRELTAAMVKKVKEERAQAL